MARHLAIDWDQQQLRVVAATLRAGKLQIERAVAWQEQQSPNIAEADALGRHLRERLKSAGIAPAPVLACVGRDRVILREVRYPAVAAGEEPAIIRFQVMKEISDSADDVVIDYAPIGEAAPGEERRALVLTVRRELLAAYQNLCKAAGLKLLALTPRPFATLACLHASMDKWEGSVQGAVGVVAAGETWSEFCLVRDHTVLVARSLPAGPTLASEIRRNIAVYTAQSPRHTVSGLFLAGNGENAALQESLQAALEIPVRCFDPFTDAEGVVLPEQSRGVFAGAVGLLRAQGNGHPLPINFASPKQPQAARDPNKRRLALGVGVAALFLIGLIGYCYAQLAALDSEINNWQAATAELASKMPLQKEKQCFDALSKWSSGNVSWLDELYDLTFLMPPSHTILVSEMTGEQPLALGKEKPAIQMTVKGVMKDENVLIKDLIDPMAKESSHYQTGIPETAPQTGNDFPGFARQFKAQILVKQQSPTSYVRKLPGSSTSLVAERVMTKPSVGIRTAAATGSAASRIAAPQFGSNVHYASPPASGGADVKVPSRGGIPARTPSEQGRALGTATNPTDFTQSMNDRLEAMKLEQQAATMMRSATSEGVPAKRAYQAVEPPRSAPAAAPAAQKGKAP